MNTSQFQSFLGLSEEICAGASISTPSRFSENYSDHSAKSRNVLDPSFFFASVYGWTAPIARPEDVFGKIFDVEDELVP